MILFDFEQMGKELKAFRETVIYGSDAAAKIVKDECVKRKISVIAFLTHAEGDGGKNIDNIPVYAVNNVPRNILRVIRSNKCITLVVAGDPAEANLRYLGVKQNKRFSDFHIAGEHIAKKQGEWDKEKWLQHIDKWYAREHNEKNDFDFRLTKSVHDKALLLILNSGARVIKVIRGLKHHNIEVESVFFAGTVQDTLSYETVKNESIACHTLDSFVDIIHLTAHTDAKFIMMFSHVWYLDYLLLFRYIIERKRYLCPVVFDEYDVGAYYFSFDQNNLMAERDCIEKADVVTDRTFEAGFLEEQGRYRPKGKIIQLQDCCTELPIPSVILKDDRPLSLVYGGGVIFDEDHPDMVNWHKFIKDCEENKCHLHLYPSVGAYKSNKTGKFAEYIRISENSEYFHFHEPVPFDALHKTEAMYDYGICPFIKAEDEERDKWGYYHKEKRLVANTNKYYDYIDAGIPLVINYPVKLTELLSEFGIVVNYAVGEYDFEYLKAHRDELRAKVPAAKAKLLMKDHIVKLLDLVLPKN